MNSEDGNTNLEAVTLLENDKDEGYDSENEDTNLDAVLHPEKYHTPDEVDHVNEVLVEGVDDDHGYNDQI